ncbi:MAG: hypothetical protein KIS96_05090 [Bauldia sp.]|nr:hypothetical protein [Bauldia sp.]
MDVVPGDQRFAHDGQLVRGLVADEFAGQQDTAFAALANQLLDPFPIGAVDHANGADAHLLFAVAVFESPDEAVMRQDMDEIAGAAATANDRRPVGRGIGDPGCAKAPDVLAEEQLKSR